MKIFIKLWLFAFAALVLAGCGDGGNNGSSTSSNGPTTFYVINTDAYDYASVKIVGSDGSTIYSGDFKCAAKTECEFGAAMDQPGKILFYNAQGAVINSYILSSTPSSLTYIKTSRRMLGIYIQGELLKRYPETLTAVGNKLNVFFTNYDSADQQPDKYEELGIYYQYRIAGGGDKLDAFYTSLHEQLENGTKLPKPLNPIASISRIFKSLFAALGSTEVISTANASISDVMCSSAAQGVLKLGSGIGGVFLPAFDPLIESFADMGSDVCNDKSSKAQFQNIQDKLAAIQHQLDTIQASLDVIDGKLNLLISNEVNKLISAVQLDNDQLDNRYTGSYKVLIKTTRSKTLKEYIETHGGLSKAMTQKEVKDVLDLASQWTLLDKIGDPISKNSLVSLLAAECANPIDKPNFDIIQMRQECNKAIVYYKTLVLESHGTYLNILKDVTDTVQYYRDSGSAADKKVALTLNFADGSAPDSWQNSFETNLKPKINATLAGLTDFVTVGSNINPSSPNAGPSRDLYYLQSGLPSGLVKNMVSAWCDSTAAGDTVANITHWIKNGDDSYIGAICTNAGRAYNSRYLYQKGGDDVANVLGVLVPRVYTRDSNSINSSWQVNNVFLKTGGDQFALYSTTDKQIAPSVLTPGGSQAVKLVDDVSPRLDGYSFYHFVLPTYLYVRYTSPTVQGEPLSYVWETGALFGSVVSYCINLGCSPFQNGQYGRDSGLAFTSSIDPSGPTMHMILGLGRHTDTPGPEMSIPTLAFTIDDNGKSTSIVPSIGWDAVR